MRIPESKQRQSGIAHTTIKKIQKKKKNILSGNFDEAHN